MLTVETIPALKDNYIFLLHDMTTKDTVVVDPSESAPVLSFLEDKKWNLTGIWNTHHHWDHVGGNLELKKNSSCKIWGPKKGTQKIPGVDYELEEGEELTIGDKKVTIIETPGHTAKALCFWIEQENLLFCGDSLFSLGCGRLFEGTAKELWQSLQKIKKLPKETLIYCAHEYTLQNSYFALKVDPHNQELKDYHNLVKKKREQDEKTVPTLLERELKTNPFLRTDHEAIRKSTETQDLDEWQVFKKLRQLKDSF